ncbi:PRC-barrel domain-containing protein, partial [Thermodesulfitimonas sp.]
MRLGELIGKEIVNLYDGARLGVVGESDLTIDAETGQVHS